MSRHDDFGYFFLSWMAMGKAAWFACLMGYFMLRCKCRPLSLIRIFSWTGTVYFGCKLMKAAGKKCGPFCLSVLELQIIEEGDKRFDILLVRRNHSKRLMCNISKPNGNDN